MPLPVGQPLSAVLPRIERAAVPSPAPAPRVSETSGLSGASGSQETGGASFADRLKEFAQEVNQGQVEAEHMATEYAAGRNDDIHGTMLTMQKADITLHLFANIRNRVVEAYKEIARMGA